MDGGAPSCSAHSDAPALEEARVPRIAPLALFAPERVPAPKRLDDGWSVPSGFPSEGVKVVLLRPPRFLS
jgi:hypothetical protein